MLFDSHCHLDAEEYDPDRPEVLARAYAAGVCDVLVPSCTWAHWPQIGALCATSRALHCAIGLHPWYLEPRGSDAEAAALERLSQAARELGAVAIGECGLDGPRAKVQGPDLARQEAVLEAHLDAAFQLELPLVLHCVGAHGRMVELLERRGRLPRGGVLHSYSGSAELLARYAKLGLYFGFAGMITREQAKRPRRALQAVPLDRLLLESDGPDQPAAGQTRSEPAHLRAVLSAASQLRSESLERLAQATTENAHRLFGTRPRPVTQSC